MNKKKPSSLNEFLFELATTSFFSEINKGSFLSLFFGGKTLSLEYISNRFLKDVQTFFSNQSYLYIEYSSFDEHEFIVYFSFDKQLLGEFKINFEKYISGDNYYIEYIGKALGFPSCCTRVFSNFFKEIKVCDMKYHMFDFISQIAKVSKTFDKRLDIFRENRFIFHTPCSFGCRDSIKIADKTFDILSRFSLSLQDEKSYMYFYLPTNEYFQVDKLTHLITSGVYYEYNHSGETQDVIFSRQELKDVLQAGKYDYIDNNVLFLNFS